MASKSSLATPYSSRAEFEVKYGEALREIPKEQLLEVMSLGEARFTVMVAKMGGDILKTGVSEKALECVYNVAVYDDPEEDFIYSHDVMDRYTSAMKASGKHEDAGKLRLMRSAFVVIHLSETDTTVQDA